MPLPAAALDAMLKATGKPVVFNGVRVYGKLRIDESDENVDGSILNTPSRRYVVLLRDGALSNLTIDAPIAVDGQPYQIHMIGPAKPDGTRPIQLTPVPRSAASRWALRLGAPLIALAGLANQRFRGAGTLGTPPNALAGSGDNGIFLALAAGDPLPAGASFARNGPATYVDANGALQQVGANVERTGHFVNGVQVRLHEPSSKNDVKNNTAVGAGVGVLPNGWSLNASGGVSPTVLGTVAHALLPGLVGVRFQVVNNTAAPVTPSVNCGPTAVLGTAYVTNAVRSLSAYISASTLPAGATARLVAFYWDVAGVFATSAGPAQFAPGAAPARASGQASTNNVAAVWEQMAIQFSVPANSTAVYEVYVPQDELGSFVTSVILTAGAAVTRPGDNVVLPEPFGPQVSTWYTKLVNLGTSLITNGRIWQVGEALSANGNLCSIRVYSTGAGAFLAILTDATGTTIASSTCTIATALADILEFFVQLFPDNTVQLSVSVNGAAFVAGTRGAPSVGIAQWGVGGAPVTGLTGRADGGAVGCAGVIAHKRARNLKSSAQMRAFTS